MTPASLLMNNDWVSFGPVTQFVAHKFCSQSTDGATISAEVTENTIGDSLQNDPLLITIAVH